MAFRRFARSVHSAPFVGAAAAATAVAIVECAACGSAANVSSADSGAQATDAPSSASDSASANSSSDATTTPQGDGAANGDDAASAFDGAIADAAPAVLAPCITDASDDDAGDFAFNVPGDLCFTFTPVQTGEPATGENATFPHYALRSATTVPTTLVLFFIGSGGHPSGPLKADPATNLYAAAVSDGRAVLGLSYKNEESIGMICRQNDPCYFPTREEIILGTSEPDSGIVVTPDESVVDRTAKALRYLASGDPDGGWSQFLTTLDPAADPASTIVWSKILAAGHSQGGGHAVAVGKLFPVQRVVQLSSTCDTNGSGAASWTNGSVGPWASDPTEFFGFGAPTTFDQNGNPVSGDTTCPYHTQNWTNLGLKKNHRNNDAAVCGNTGDTHDESLRCTDNYSTWVTLFQ